METADTTLAGMANMVADHGEAEAAAANVEQRLWGELQNAKIPADRIVKNMMVLAQAHQMMQAEQQARAAEVQSVVAVRAVIEGLAETVVATRVDIDQTKIAFVENTKKEGR